MDSLLHSDEAVNADLVNGLRYLMCRRGWSQTELARRSGMSVQTVNNLVLGKNVPCRKYLYRLVVGLGVSMDEFREIAISPEAKLFEDATVRAVASKMPLTPAQRTQIVRFINQHCPRRTAA